MDFSILSRHDDMLASYFVDNLYLWFKTIRMNNDFQGVAEDQQKVASVIRTMAGKNPVKQAAEKFLEFPYFKEYLSNLPPGEASGFIRHLHRYLHMFSYAAGFEISSTTRYTGTMEACIVATRDWKAGEHVQFCLGAIAELSKEDDAKLKSEGRDFSVMVSIRRKCTCLFLGPARFMNHDCDANCKFILDGRISISFKVQRDIKCGEEMTVYYGDHYFGINNCECKCSSCERLKQGSFSVHSSETEETQIGDVDNSDSGTSSSTVVEEQETNYICTDGKRRSGRARKVVDYKAFLKLRGYPIKYAKAERTKAQVEKPKKKIKLPLMSITNLSTTQHGRTQEAVTSRSIERPRLDFSTSLIAKTKQLEMELDFILNNRQYTTEDWLCRPIVPNTLHYATDDSYLPRIKRVLDINRRRSTGYIGRDMLFPFQPMFPKTFMPIIDQPMRDVVFSEIKKKDEDLVNLQKWLDNQSDMSDNEGSILSEVNDATCCETAKERPSVITSSGRVLCARCYRHWKIFGMEWPERREKKTYRRKRADTNHLIKNN